MDISLFWARVFGLLLSMYALMIFAQRKKFIKLLRAAAQNSGVMYLTGFISLILGVVIIVTHQVWSYDWRGLITIFGWLAIGKGVIRTLYPERVKKTANYFMKNESLYTGALVITLLVGLYFLYVGFWQGMMY